MTPPLLLLALFFQTAVQPSSEIKVNQVGYLPSAPKIAMVVSKNPATAFNLRRAGNGAVVLQGKLSSPVKDPNSGDEVRLADFTSVRDSGAFYLEVPGVGRSWEFAIRPDVYSRVFYLAMRSFYGQRCGTEVNLGPEFPGYKYAACHSAGAFHASSGKTGLRQSARGWHDAGDYGRYVVNSGLSTGTLLWTWELFGPRLKNLTLDIPESGNGVPDILNEIKWNLDWMLSMQDEDGGVWHKQTSEQFCGFVMPENDRAVSYVIGTGKQPYKSSCATANFAAVLAIAGRIYKPFDASYAHRCLEAARLAWLWVNKYPDIQFRNPEGVFTGGYGDGQCGDERLWAGAELWRTTGDETYHNYFVQHFEEYVEAIRAVGPPSWANVAGMALWTYVLGGGKNTEVVFSIRQKSLAVADEIVARSGRNGYRISMTPEDYVWGSNGVAANYGLQLLVAYAIGRDPRYHETALENLHYLLGRNAFSLSWVTQVGANPYRHPHHRPSGADNNREPWPGLLSGGPNRSRQDPAMKGLPDLPPARMYVDDEASYASNEIAINWNAPLVFLLAGVLAPE